MARVVGNIAALKKPLTGGEKIPDGTCYKETAFTRILKNSWNGTAFTVFLFCMSMHPRNGGESWCTMEMAERCSKLRANVTRPKPFNLKELIKEYKESIISNTKIIQTYLESGHGKSAPIFIREALINNAKLRLNILEILEEGK